MKSIKFKIFLVLVMLIPLPFSCLDDSSTCLDLYAPPYWRMMGMVFNGIDEYYINPNSEKPMFNIISQDFENFIYPSDSIALEFIVPNEMLQFHAQNTMRKGFSMTQEAFACNPDRPGYQGTLDLVERIHISSNYDFDEMHPAGFDLTDIVDIFVYTQDEESGGFRPLREYNEMMPHIAPKRVYLLLTRNARLSPIQQFVVRFHLMEIEGRPARHFTVETPVINVKIR